MKKDEFIFGLKVIFFVNLVVLIMFIVDVFGVYMRFWGKDPIICTTSIRRYASINDAIMYIIFMQISVNIVLLVAHLYNEKTGRYILYMICPNCEYPMEVLIRDKDKAVCPKCYTKMVPLKGFYDKKNVKEFKDKSREKTNKSS